MREREKVRKSKNRLLSLFFDYYINKQKTYIWWWKTHHKTIRINGLNGEIKKRKQNTTTTTSRNISVYIYILPNYINLDLLLVDNVIDNSVYC